MVDAAVQQDPVLFVDDQEVAVRAVFVQGEDLFYQDFHLSYIL